MLSLNCRKILLFISVFMFNTAIQAQTPTGFNLVAYEGFNYSNNTNIANQSGGSGWAGNWEANFYGNSSMFVYSDGLSYSDLSVSGYKLQWGGSGTYEPHSVKRAINNQNSGIVYLQFIADFNSSSGGTDRVDLNSGGTTIASFGGNNAQGKMSILAGGQTINSTYSVFDLSLVIIQIDYNNNTTKMWINPPTYSTFNYSNPGTPAATYNNSIAFDEISLTFRSGGQIDEISIFAQPTSAPTSISGTTTICNGSSTTLTSSGGNLSSEGVDAWYEGTCGGQAFHQGWDIQPTSTFQTTINSNLSGILNVTSTGGDPQIDMFSLGSFDPAVYKYINFRYRVVSGTAGAAQFFFLNGGESWPDGSKYVDKTLISDNQWHTVSVDMTANPLWASGGSITGIRYDYATESGATLDLDFIELSAAPIVGTGSSITVTPSGTTTYYANRKGYTVNTICVSQTVTVNPLPSAPTATAIQRFCSSDTVASLQATVAAGETLAWFASATGGSELSAATTLAEGHYYAQASTTFGCSSARTLVVVSFNNALYFDGANDYVSLTSNSIPDGATEFTIEAWIKPDDSNFDGAYHAVFGNQTGANATTRNPSFYLKSGGIHIDSYEDNTLTRYDFLTPASGILQNVWSHIALVKQGNLFYVYINGQLSFTTAAPTNINITGPYQFGYIDNYFAGKMDEIRFWSVARTASEIASNMNQFLSGTEIGLVDYYTFDQGIQNGSNVGLTTLYDITASANNGTLNNFALTGATSNYVPGYFAQIVGTSTIQLGTNSQLSHVISGGSWTSSNTNIATVSNSGLVTSVAVGSAIVSYTSCGQTTTVTITVTASPPTISNFNNISKMYHDGSFTIGAPTSNSTGSFSYTSSNTNVATISGTTVTIHNEGTSTITANQAQDSTYQSGSISALLTVSSVEVLTVHGEKSKTKTSYIDSNGKKGGTTAVTKYGEIKAIKTP